MGDEHGGFPASTAENVGAGRPCAHCWFTLCSGSARALGPGHGLPSAGGSEPPPLAAVPELTPACSAACAPPVHMLSYDSEPGWKMTSADSACPCCSVGR